MAMLFSLAKWLNVVNIILILVLLYVYGKSFKKIKAPFTFGLLMFGLLFLVQNIVALYYAVTMMPLYADGVEAYAFFYTLFQTLALAVLDYISLS